MHQKRGHNQYRFEPVNGQEDNTKPQNIPTIINGCVSPSKDEEVFSFHNYVSELYPKLPSSKNNLSKSLGDKILLIADSTL